MNAGCICFPMPKHSPPPKGAWRCSRFADFLRKNGVGKRLQTVSSSLNLRPLCRSCCRGAYLPVQTWICCPEIGLGNKALKIGGWVTLIISANDTLTVARSTGEWRLYHVQLSKADSVHLALPWTAAFLLMSATWNSMLLSLFWKGVVHWYNVLHYNSAIQDEKGNDYSWRTVLLAFLFSPFSPSRPLSVPSTKRTRSLCLTGQMCSLSSTSTPVRASRTTGWL